MGVSIRAYARHRGVAENAVRKAIKAGRITPDSNGKIDVAKADAAWEANTDHTKRHDPAGFKDIDPEEAMNSVKQTLAENGRAAHGMNSFTQARTAHEIAKAHLARLRLQRMKGELIDRARATALVFRMAREERDTWVNWPARVAALIAAELGVEAHPMQKALETHVRAHLAELAEVRPEFR